MLVGFFPFRMLWPRLLELQSSICSLSRRSWMFINSSVVRFRKPQYSCGKQRFACHGYTVWGWNQKGHKPLIIGIITKSFWKSNTVLKVRIYQIQKRKNKTSDDHSRRQCCQTQQQIGGPEEEDSRMTAQGINTAPVYLTTGKRLCVGFLER